MACRLLTALFVVMVFVGVSGCTTQRAGESEKPKKAAEESAKEDKVSEEKAAKEATTRTTQAAATTSTAGAVTTTTAKTAAEPAAVIETPRGVIKFKFYPKDAPNTVANFIKLAKSGFYDGTKFHRIEPGFVIQGGDPNSLDDDPSNDGLGGPGYTIKAEFNSRLHLDGAVAMARSQHPDSAGSQFYVTIGPQPHLDGNYTVFGQVTEGLDVVRKVLVGDAMKVKIVE